MNFLSKVTKGKIVLPLFGILYGTEGIGKTTFGAQLPDVIFIGPEAPNNFDVARMPKPKDWPELLGQLKELLEEDHSFKSICIDSVDWCEGLLVDYICTKEKVKTLQEIPWGGSSSMMIHEWREFIYLCTSIREKRKMNILMLAHFQVKQHNDPLVMLPYDRYSMKLNEKSSALLREAVDFVFFATNKIYSTSSQKRATKGKGIGGEERVIYTEKRASHDAKNRFSLPYEMPLDYSEITTAIKTSDVDKIKEISKDIDELILDISDAEFKKIVIETKEKVGNNFQGLELLKNRLLVRLNKEGVKNESGN